MSTVPTYIEAPVAVEGVTRCYAKSFTSDGEYWITYMATPVSVEWRRVAVYITTTTIGSTSGAPGSPGISTFTIIQSIYFDAPATLTSGAIFAPLSPQSTEIPTDWIVLTNTSGETCPTNLSRVSPNDGTTTTATGVSTTSGSLMATRTDSNPTNPQPSSETSVPSTSAGTSLPTNPIGSPISPNHSRIIAAIVGTLVGLFILILVGFVLIRRRRRRKIETPFIPSELDGMSPQGAVARKPQQFPSFSDKPGWSTSTAPLLLTPTPKPEPALDDQALGRLFSDLDNKITDHVVNYWRTGEIASSEYQNYINAPGSKTSWKGILFQGRPLLANIGARIHMFRALLGYHVYTCIADWRIFTTEQQAQITSGGNSARRKYSRTLQDSETKTRERINIIMQILERETGLHVSEKWKTDNLHLQSLKEIAVTIVLLGIKLGSQVDNFKFLFRNKDSEEGVGEDSLAVKFLGKMEINSDNIEVINEMGGTVRALISPGVIRVSKNKEYIVKKALVYTA